MSCLRSATRTRQLTSMWTSAGGFVACRRRRASPRSSCEQHCVATRADTRTNTRFCAWSVVIRIPRKLVGGSPSLRQPVRCPAVGVHAHGFLAQNVSGAALYILRLVRLKWNMAISSLLLLTMLVLGWPRQVYRPLGASVDYWCVVIVLDRGTMHGNLGLE